MIHRMKKTSMTVSSS